MRKINGYLLSNRVAEMLEQVELLPHYVMAKFKTHFTEDAILASWIQYYTYPEMRKENSFEDYITYMFDKCAEYDRKSKHLNLLSVYVEEGYWNVDIEEDILSTFN